MIEFRKKTYADILADQLKRVPDTIDKREGSIIQTALGPESWYLEGVYLDMESMQKNIYAETAGGVYLDRIATESGITRKQPTSAVKTGTFNIQIPIGSRFSSVGSQRLTYTATEYSGVTAEGHAYMMQCETEGEAGNSYVGQLMAIDYVPGLISSQLTTLLSAGTDEETDESLRNRILTAIRKPSTSGNRYDYYNWAMEYAGVGAAKVFPLADGPGTVRVVIADVDKCGAGAALVKSVKEHIEELRPIGATVTVVSAVEKKIHVNARIRIKDGLSLGGIQDDMAVAVADFLQQNAFDITYVSLARIGSLLLGVSGVEDFSELTLNGAAGNVMLNKEEIAVAGTVSLEVM